MQEQQLPPPGDDPTLGRLHFFLQASGETLARFTRNAKGRTPRIMPTGSRQPDRPLEHFS